MPLVVGTESRNSQPRGSVTRDRGAVTGGCSQSILHITSDEDVGWDKLARWKVKKFDETLCNWMRRSGSRGIMQSNQEEEEHFGNVIASGDV